MIYLYLPIAHLRITTGGKQSDFGGGKRKKKLSISIKKVNHDDVCMAVFISRFTCVLLLYNETVGIIQEFIANILVIN